MKAFVTGGTGFVGRHIVTRLIADGVEVRLLCRPGSEGKLPGELLSSMEIVHGDPFDRSSLKEGFMGVDGVINLIGIIRDFPSRGITFEKVHFEALRNISDQAREEGVKRFIQVSALGVDWDERTEYFRTKWKADQYLIDHDHDYTIFRPSLLFGEGDGFVTTLEALIRQAPIVVVPGDGKFPMQPLSVIDLAEALSRSFREGRGLRGIFNASGPGTFNYGEILSLIAKAIGKKGRALHFPLPLIIPLVILLERFESFPLTYDQLYMLTRGSVADNSSFVEEFGLTLKSFPDYLEEKYRKEG